MYTFTPQQHTLNSNILPQERTWKSSSISETNNKPVKIIEQIKPNEIDLEKFLIFSLLPV